MLHWYFERVSLMFPNSAAAVGARRVFGGLVVGGFVGSWVGGQAYGRGIDFWPYWHGDQEVVLPPTRVQLKIRVRTSTPSSKTRCFPCRYPTSTRADSAEHDVLPS